MATPVPPAVHSREHAPTTDREQVLSALFLFAGPALAFVLALLFVR